MNIYPISTSDTVATDTYGEIYGYEVSATIALGGTGIANKAQITAFDKNGYYYDTTPDHTNDHITIATTGRYLVNVSLTAASAAAGGADNMGFGVFKNNGATQYKNLHVNRTLAGGGGDNGSISLSGIAFFIENDTVEVWVWNYDSADDVVIDDINLSLVMLSEEIGNPITGNPMGLLLALTYS